jgi:hypothetical protein
MAANADSTRRWQDPKSRDTVVVSAPAEFTVDMTSGPVVIEVVKGDSVKVVAQLTPARGPIVTLWGKALVVESDGVAPWITRR